MASADVGFISRSFRGFSRGFSCSPSRSPEYVTNITDPTELKQVLKNHVDAVMGRYGDRMYAIDVINERESFLQRTHTRADSAPPHSPIRQRYPPRQRVVQRPWRRLPRDRCEFPNAIARQ